MRAEIYPISGIPNGRMAVLPRPRGGDWLAEEIASLRQAGVDCLVALVTQEEINELDLGNEAVLCAANDIAFLSFPIEDRSVPASAKEVHALARKLAALVETGKFLAVHCRQGVGRSALLVACVLVALGEDVDRAFSRISAARGCPVPDTEKQRAWVLRFAQSFDRHAGSEPS